MEFFHQLLSPDFMPHGYCYLWDPAMLWLHVVSDALITLSYYCIPVVLIYFIRKNREIPFNRIFWMFGTFILACGTTHLMEIWNVWHSNYLLAGVIKAVTAAVSVITAAMLIPLVPKVISLPGRIRLQEVNHQLEREIAERVRFDVPIDAPLKRRVTVGFVVAVVLTVFIGFASWRGARLATQDAYWVSHTYEVMETIERTSRHLIEAGTSARAFALSGQEPLLVHYQTARDTVYKDEAVLQRLTADNLTQQRHLGVLEPQLRAALEFAESIIAQRRKLQVYPGGSDALEIERLMDVARATTREMRAEEIRLLSQRTQRASAGQRLTGFIAILGTLLSAGLWGMAKLAVNREIGVSARARAQVIALNAKLEQRVEQRTSALQSEIAERRRAEDAVRESLAASKAALRELADQKFALDQHAIVAVTDVQGTINYVNDKFCAISKYSKDELIGQNHRILNSRYHPTEFFQQMYRTIANGKVWHGEIRNRAKDGSIYWVDTTIVPFMSGDGKPEQYVAIRADITKRKQAEDEVKESLATSKAALKQLADQKFALDQHAIVAVTDVQGTITYVNDKFCAISKYSKTELIGQNHRILNSGHHAKEFFQQMYHTIANGKVWHGEIKNRAKDESIYWVDTTIVPFVGLDGKPRQYVAIRADITERKQAEDALNEQARILDLAQVMVRDTKGHIVLWNLGAETLYGYSREEAIGRLAHEMLQTEFPEPLEQIERKLESNGTWEGELVHRKRDGGHVIVASVWVLHRDAQGCPLRILVSSTDITQRRRAEEALREQAQLLDSAQVFVRDMESRVVFWPRGAEKLYGFTSQEALGILSHDLFHTQFPEPLEMVEKKLFETGMWEGELVHRKRDGTIIVVASAWALHRNSQGQPIRILETNADITARKQAEESLTLQAKELARSQQALETQTGMLESVLDSMSEGLVTADEQGKFVLWNPAAQKILGMGAADLPNQEWTGHYGLFMADTVTPFPPDQIPLVRAIRGEVSVTEMFVRNPEVSDGAWIEVSAGPLKDKDGKVRGGVAAFRDITERRAAEREIRKLNDELEARVIQRTAALEAANQELEAFTYSVSHDLRAPLRHITGFTRILVEEFGPSLPEGAQHHLQRIEHGARRMGLLVDDLLNLARVGRQSLSVQVTGLGPIVNDVVSLLEPEAEGRKVEWKIAALPFVECDPALIRQVFQNLMGNALKYSRPRASAVIEIGQIEKDGQVAIFVKDNGVGFSMKYADKLFGVFQRLHRPEDFEGTGVGLATAQRIIQKHGGRIWAEAELEKGATFYFTLGGFAQSVSQNAAATTGGQS